MEEEEVTFIFQVFPSGEWMHAVITPTNNAFARAQNVKNMCTINADELRRFVSENEQGTRIEVGVWRGEGARTPLLSLESVGTLGNYSLLALDKGFSGRFERILTSPPFQSKEIFSVDKLRDILVVVNVIPTIIMEEEEEEEEEVLPFNYKMPPLPENVSFEVSIYNRKDRNEKKLLNAYIREVEEENENLDEPFLLIKPIPDDENNVSHIHDEDKIVFIAKSKETQKVIGYCACFILAYKQTRSTRRAMGEIFVDKLFSATNDLRSRYFVDVEPHDIFEIEGLSAHPKEARKDIGLILVWVALRFCRDAKVKEQHFPKVTHVASHAVSAITKRLLTQYFGFRYHGSNLFMNQSFIDTLSYETQAINDMVDAVSDMIETFIFLIKVDRDKAGILQSKATEPLKLDVNPVATLVASIIKLYHLFYLIAKGTEQFKDDQTKKVKNIMRLADGLILVFEEVEILFRDQISEDKTNNNTCHNLYRYINNNREALQIYVKNNGIGENDPFKRNNTIYTSFLERSAQHNILEKYGFLYLAVEDKKDYVKVTYSEGYEVILGAYNVISTICNVVQSKARKLPRQTFDTLSNLIRKDIENPYNYSIPSHEVTAGPGLVQIDRQLDRIYAVLENIRANPSFFATISNDNEDVLKSLLVAIKEQQARIANNHKLGSHMVLQVYDMKEGAIDTLTSFEALDANWQKWEDKVIDKITRKPPPRDPNPLPARIREIRDIELPKDRDTLFKDHNTLFELLPPSSFAGKNLEEVVKFNGKRYTVETIMKHFAKLTNMRDTYDGCVVGNQGKEGEEIEIDVNVEADTPESFLMIVDEGEDRTEPHDHDVYNIEEFIDIENERRYKIEDEEGGIMNKEPI